MYSDYLMQNFNHTFRRVD